MKRFFIGTGSGRCGTMSLAELVNGCKGVNVFHELKAKENPEEILSYERDEKQLLRKLKLLESLEGSLVGDVALYYLNHIDWFFQHLSNLKVIYIWRNKEEVVDSYIRKTEQRVLLNHWWSEERKKGTSYVLHHRWDKAYPKFDKTKTKREAIAKFWDWCMKKGCEIKKKFPDKILMINVYDLNCKFFQKIIFDFLEIPESDRNYRLLWKNRGRK